MEYSNSLTELSVDDYQYPLTGLLSILPKEDSSRDFFEKLASVYSFANRLSLGVASYIRRECVRYANIQEGMRVCDFMTGTGEIWPLILPKLGINGAIVAVDFTPGMLRKAANRRVIYSKWNIALLSEDALSSSIADRSVDAVICSLGIKTLSLPELGEFAREIARVLKPGGTFSVSEIFLPTSQTINLGMRVYLRYIIPIICWLSGRDSAPLTQLLTHLPIHSYSPLILNALSAAGLEASKRPSLCGMVNVFFGAKKG